MMARCLPYLWLTTEMWLPKQSQVLEPVDGNVLIFHSQRILLKLF